MTSERPREAAVGAKTATGSRADLPEPVMPQERLGESLVCTLPEPVTVACYDLRVLEALRRIIRAVDLHSRKLLAQYKITSPQLVCLLSVNEHEPVTPSAIARHIHLSPSTVIGILDRLEAKGLIRRERDLKDRRLVHVSITEGGKALVGSAPSPLQDTFTEAMSQRPEAEQEAIADALDRIVEMMEVGHIDAAPILETGPISPPIGPGKVVEPPGAAEPSR